MLEDSNKLEKILKTIEKIQIKPNELKISDWFLLPSSKRLVAAKANKCLETEIVFLNLCINMVKYVYDKYPDEKSEEIKIKFPLMKDVAKVVESKDSNWRAIGHLFTFRDKRGNKFTKKVALKTAKEIQEEILKKCNKYANDFEKIKKLIEKQTQ